MSNQKGTIITSMGLKLITKLTAGKGPLEFTKVKVGTGSLPEGMDAAELTHLIAYKMEGMIAEYGYDSEEMDAYVVMQISNEEIETGFVMTEIGIYALDPDVGEILYAYVDLSDDPNYIMPSENGRSKIVQVKLHVIVGAATNITAAIHPGSLITAGHITNQNTITEDGKYVLDAIQANPDIKGTLANQIRKLDELEFDDSGAVDEIKDFPSFLATWVSGTKITTLLRNLKAGLKFVLHTGQLVNNCVTDRPDMPLAAAQGKVLMDLCTKLNSDITVLNDKITWKLLKRVNGRQIIELPQNETFSELIIMLSYTYSVTRNYFMAIPTISLPITEQRANMGTGQNNGLGEDVSISLAISATYIKLVTFIFAGVAHEADTSLTVYYK